MADNKKTVEKKGFLARLMESLDKKMAQKAAESCCCASKPKDQKKSSCC